MKTSWFLLDAGEIDQFSPFDALPIGCILVKGDKIISANLFFSDLVGVDKIGLAGKPLDQFIIGANIQSLLKLSDKKSLELELQTTEGVHAYTVNVNTKSTKDEESSIWTFTRNTNDKLFKSDGATTAEGSQPTAKLAQSQSMLESVLDLSNSYFVYTDNDYRICYYNESASQIHKVVVGKDLQKGILLSDYYGKEGFEQRQVYYDQAKSGIEVKRKINFTQANKKRYVDISYKAVLDDAGNQIGTLEFGLDVSELIESRKQQASGFEELQESTKALNNSKSIIDHVLTALDDAIYVYDQNLELLYFNEVARLLHRRVADIDLVPGMSFEAMYPEVPMFKNFRELHEKALEDCQPISQDLKLNIDGKKNFYHCTLKCIFDKNGKVIGLVGTSKDFTSRIEDNRELEKTNNTLYAILESTSDGVSAIDTNFNFIAYNEKAIEEFKEFLDIDITIGKSLKSQVDEALFSKWNDEIYCKVFGGETILTEVSREENTRFFNNIYTPVFGHNNEVTAILEVSREITEVKKAKENLELREYQFRTLIEHSPFALLRVSTQGIINYVSPRGEQIYGLSADEVIGRPITDFVNKDSHAALINGLQKLMNRESEAWASVEAKNQRGEDIFLEGIATLLSDENGEPKEIFLSFLDVTKEREAEKRLIVSEGNYNSLFANTENAILVYDFKTGAINDCNNAAVKLFDKTREKLLETKDLDLFPQFTNHLPKVDQHKLVAKIKSAIENDEKIENQLFIVKQSDGFERYTKLNVVRAIQESSLVYIMISDETESIQKNILIEEKSSIYEALIHNSFDGIDIIKYKAQDGYIVDGQLIVRNEQMKKIVGSTSDRLFDREDDLLSISPEFQRDGSKSLDVIRKVVVDTIKEGNTKIEYRFEHESGCCDVVASQKMFQFDNLVYMIKNYRNVTDEVKQKQIIQDQLEVLNAKNEEMKKYIESNLQLENFAYIASHDLKAPIRSVISFAQLLKNNVGTTLEDKNARFLDIIITASTNMQVLIDDLLSFSRINTQAIEFENVDLPKLINHLLIEVSEPVEAVKGKVEIVKLPETMVADASRIRQIFQNLIMNGMKFYKEGETPFVTVDYQESDSKFTFSVKDHGIGIEPQYLREIFLMFKKLHSENKFKGTGIGLSICKKIVEQHNGDIWVESELGKGATFYFTICKHIEPNI